MFNIYVVLDKNNNVVIANMGDDDLKAISSFKEYIDEAKKEIVKDDELVSYNEFIKSLKVIKVCSVDIPAQLVKSDFSLLAFLGGEKPVEQVGDVNE